MKKLIALIMACMFILTMTVGCTPKTTTDNAKTIKIGTIQPMSGQVAAYGIQTTNAIKIAIDEVNAAGGVLGKQLELVVADDEANPEKTLTAFKRQATQDKIIALIGALTSKCSKSINNEANARKIIMISPSSTADDVTAAGPYVFRACYNDSFQGQVVAKFGTDNLKAKTAAIIYDVANDYSTGLRDTFKAKFTEYGGTIVAEESYTTNDTDFSSQITKIKSSAPDIIFIPDYYSTVALISKQIRAQGIKVPMLGADGWDEIANQGTDDVVGCYYSNHYSPDANDPEVKAFVDKYKATYSNETPNALAALGYDALYILVDAIKLAGTTDSAKIQEAMMKTNKKFVTGQISFNELRNPVKSAVMVKLEKGEVVGKPKVVYAATVNP